MALIGYQLTRNESSMTLMSAWRIETRTYPIGERKIVSHLLDSTGSVVGQDDSFAASYNTLFPGDLFFQVQTIPLDGVSAGKYWLQMGLYDPDTGVRLLADGLADRVLLQPLILAD